MLSKSVFLPSNILDEMVKHVSGQLPEEACGLLAGKERRIQLMVPIENQLHAPNRFRMEGKAQLEAFSKIEILGMELIAIFHSHPNGPSQPSETDIREHAYPDILSIICFTDEHQLWNLGAFHILDGIVSSYPICFT